ncbi:nucleic acid binding [Ascochyta rabiei]|uniref:Nucleic acid binding n=1 Tax=Didymella rabiei TaxID=5454 RepID=A0A163CVT7_DIDRA|nr:nucleic acid binding [Ascochyta rabiei]
MNHQVQGLVLVDNEWVSRPLDVYQIMARAQQDDTEMLEPAVKPASHPQVPGYGILSRTVLPSPLFKFILPATIRHKDLNDIVLVGEDSIQLVQIHDYGRLRHAATKSDFSGRILTSRVFGDARAVHISGSVGIPLPKAQNMHRGTRSTNRSENHMLPPEVAVLTLSSRTLVFLWAQHSAAGKPVFRQKTVRLPAGSSRFDRLGQYLATDPKCRALAVAAYEGRFMLYKTKSMQTWHKELANGDDTTPIEDERIIAIEGRVMHMEFLSTAAGQDDFHVVLLFIVAHQGLTKMTCFDWDCRYDLDTVTARTERVLVDLDDQNPSLLIPLGRSPDFLLIFETHVCVYKDVLSGAPQRTVVPIPVHILRSIRPGDSTHRPRWVQWDKTPRNPDFPKEAFYIAREDGRVMYIEQGPADALDMDDAGEWPYRIDTAFACLSVDNSEFSQSYPDVLMAGAAGNDGLLSMNQFTYVESMPNWSPLTGLCVTDLPGIRNPFERERAALFVSNGVAPHGQLSELRLGLQAEIDGSFSGMNGCTGLWVMHHGSQTVELDGKCARQHYALVVVTLPLETLLLRLVRTQPESRGGFSGAWDDGVWNETQLPNEDEPVDDGINRTEETISACMLAEGFSVQITRNDAQILAPPNLALSDKIQFHTPILLAASKSGFPFIATTFRDYGNPYLDVTSVLEGGTFRRSRQEKSRHPLSADPTCIELLEVGGQPHILVGTLDSKVTLFQVMHEYEVSKIFESSLDDVNPAGRLRTLCESAVLLTSGADHILVCATREGLLLSRNIHGIKSDLPITPLVDPHIQSGAPTAKKRSGWDITKMGSTSAQIYACSTDHAAAFVSCGSDFCRVRCSASLPSVMDVESVWFTNRASPGYLQSPVTATYQLPYKAGTESTIERNLDGFLFVVSGDQMLYTQLDIDIKRSNHVSQSYFGDEDKPKVLPRKLMTGGKPSHAAYLALPRKMLAATVEAKELCAPPDGYRVIHSALILLNVHDDKSLDEVEIKKEVEVGLADRLVVAHYALNHAERVYSIVDWPFEDNRGKKYNLVIVGTGIGTGPGKETGRRLIFNLGQRGSKLSLQKESTYPHPLYCIALFNNRATVSVIGKLLSFDEFDAQLGRWINRGSKELPSPGIHVTVSKSMIFVSTLQHSHLCYEVVRQPDDSRVDIVQLFTDSRERSCTHHLALHANDLRNDAAVGEESLVLLTDKKTATISGLYHSGEVAFKNAATTLFEARLPRTVVRLQRGDIRPAWRRPSRFTKRSDRLEGILVDDIIGACSDGTIYAFSIMSEPAHVILRLLQNLVELKQARDPARQFTIVKHRSGDIFDVLMNGADGAQDCAIRARDVDPRHREREVSAPKNSHIDGDVLLKFFNEGGDLRDLISTHVEPEVTALLEELGRSLLLHNGYYLQDGHASAANILVCIKEWMDEVLMPLL